MQTTHKIPSQLRLTTNGRSFSNTPLGRSISINRYSIELLFSIIFLRINSRFSSFSTFRSNLVNNSSSNVSLKKIKSEPWQRLFEVKYRSHFANIIVFLRVKNNTIFQTAKINSITMLCSTMISLMNKNLSLKISSKLNKKTQFRFFLKFILNLVHRFFQQQFKIISIICMNKSRI